MFSTCSIFLEINTACSNITCQNGGSCVYINETSNAICSCYNNFVGEFCQGISIVNLISVNICKVQLTYLKFKHLNISPCTTQKL